MPPIVRSADLQDLFLKRIPSSPSSAMSPSSPAPQVFPGAAGQPKSRDEILLAEMGYEQEFKRE
jgi:hypothetical protein